MARKTSHDADDPPDDEDLASRQTHELQWLEDTVLLVLGLLGQLLLAVAGLLGALLGAATGGTTGGTSDAADGSDESPPGGRTAAPSQEGHPHSGDRPATRKGRKGPRSKR